MCVFEGSEAGLRMWADLSQLTAAGALESVA